MITFECALTNKDVAKIMANTETGCFLEFALVFRIDQLG